MPSILSFKDMPIGRKLLAIGLLVTGVMLLLLATLSIVKSAQDSRRQLVAQLTATAEIMGANTAPALLFSDKAAAADTLSALKAEPDVVFAGVYGSDGALFASHGTAARGPRRLAPPPTGLSHAFGNRELVLSEPISFRGERIGSIYLKADLQRTYSDALGNVLLTLATAAGAFILAAVLFLRLQKTIVGPIAELSGIMRTMAASADYRARAPIRGADEVGVLANSFNAMVGAIQERDTRLAHHQAELEEAVRQRTSELKDANGKLQTELVQRKAAQEALHAHDAMLKAVARSAAELLGSMNPEEALTAVLELIGQTMAVTRVILCPATTKKDSHLHATVANEWFAPGQTSLLGDPIMMDMDITRDLPTVAAASLVGERSILTVDDVSPAGRALLEHANATSLLVVPIMSEGKLWGGLIFGDASAPPRTWSWAETDTLATLAGLMGAAITRMHYVKELADANTIVQNSPTVLYRLKGEPQLPLTYISHNITKFGYDPKALVASGKFFQTLVHPDDQTRVMDAMLDVLDKQGAAATIEFRLTLPSGASRWVENRYTPVRDEVGRLVEIEGIVIDITERKAAEEKIALLARTDALTGLANRATFVERLHQAFAATRRGAAPFAVLYLDLDHFKDINDTRGHPVGDLLLKEVGERLKGRIRESDLVARLGGDEFAILQSDIGDPSDAGALAAGVIETLSAPYLIDNAELHVTASVGISPCGPETASPDAMLAQADLALYRAKEEGRHQYRFHSVELDKQVAERVSIAEDLRTALQRNELYLDYQPQVELQSGRIVGMEALIRWRHPRRGVLKPAQFLPVAEAAGVIPEVGRWVLRNACEQMSRWKEEGVPPPVIAVNLSMQQLKNGAEFVRDVTETLKATGVKPGELELDVTESILARVTLTQNDVLDRLKEMGVRIALDDFGTDYSSFDYLRAYRVNHLKVAREFIENATQDAALAATVRAIIGAAREMDIQVIAEGVETKDQRELLLAMGRGTKGQGFYFSEPVEVSKATELLNKGSIDPDHTSAAGRAKAPAADPG
jgi:diguanylate cyclase (GGDEF)-like protein/PAS domain S-box-containing protein